MAGYGKRLNNNKQRDKTMTMKYTAGKWTTGARITRVEATPEGWNMPMCIADCDAKHSPEDEAEKVANAWLIASAPELLEALKSTRKLLLEIEYQENLSRITKVQISSQIVDNNAAISKAEGKI
jgi:hypothetical protein